jgi:hypothetical protein
MTWFRRRWIEFADNELLDREKVAQDSDMIRRVKLESHEEWMAKNKKNYYKNIKEYNEFEFNKGW